MRIPARRYQLLLLGTLLALDGFTGLAVGTHKLRAIASDMVQRLTYASHREARPERQPTANRSLTTTPAPVQAGGSYNLTQKVIAGGGGTSTGGNHSLSGTAGQAATNVSNGGQFTVASGFWPGVAACTPLTLSPPTLPNGTLGQPYSQTITQTGGTGVINWTVSIGNLPGGLTLNATTGLLSGTPTASGTFNFTIQATDANGCAGTQAYALVIGNCPAITITPNTLPNGTVGAAYSQTIMATGGTPPYSFNVTTGTLPGGLILNATTGGLAGTPTAAGSVSFAVTATDSGGCTGTLAYTLVINPACGAITINPSLLTHGFVGTAYSQMLTATGGTPTYNFTVSAGTLPTGLALATSGLLSGTPSVAGTFGFTVQATDANNCAGTRSYSLIIGGAGLLFYPLSHPVRLLDTRVGQVGCDAPGVPISGGTSRTQTAAGRTCDGLTIPNSARALTGNITTVESGGGYLTLYPSDAQQPLVANSNYLPNEVINNVFTVGLGAADGAFKIFVTSTTHIVVDVTGYYAPPNASGLFFHPLPKPIRLLETRSGELGCFTPGTPLQGGAEQSQSAHGLCDGVTIPATARALVGNATTVNPLAGGYLTLFPADAARPLVASSNYGVGQVVNAPFTVGLSTGGAFNLFSTATTDLVVDVLGYYSTEAQDVNGAGLLFNPLPRPVRLLETRNDLSLPGCYKTFAPLQGGATRTQPARGVCDGITIANNALGIVGNATVVNAQGGYLTFWPSDAPQPLVASSNFNAGQIFNRHFTVGLGSMDGAFKIFSQLTTDLVIDVSGYFAP
jgi:hypothetical protein